MASLLQGHDGLDLLINISASPYHHGKLAERNLLLTSLCRENHLSLLYVNQVGGQDSLIFDGHSLALNTQGEVHAAASGFAEELVMVELEGLGAPAGKQVLPEDSVAQVEKALVLGLRDYLHKIGFKQAVIGLSGG